MGQAPRLPGATRYSGNRPENRGRSQAIQRVLIANRGEIALRVARACRDAGIASVAVYSDADRGAPHVRAADAAHHLGPSDPAASYLSIPAVIAAAKATGAGAVHPGYGFLAENAEFAEACRSAGLIFIGPPPEAIRLLGDKAAARRTMGKAGVPLVPGSDPLTSVEAAREAAGRIGFPLLVKAAAGGGGRGIRPVERPEDLEAAVEAASAEARQAFGDPTVYLEKRLEPVRHVEVQVLADAHGSVVALGERECSVQRRHQKLIEETPSVAVGPALRSAMQEAAVAAAQVSGYQNAGTVEFLVDSRGGFYFLEVNTRLQVEHPVTEMVTGIDLVREQLRIAAGEPLGYEQRDVQFRGAAMECRIQAEDPLAGFLPSTGRLRLLQEPAGPGVRLDSGVADGQEVTPYYDSLLAKLITWGRDRGEAMQRMRRALREYRIAGVKTVIPFHQYALQTPEFVRGDLHTGFVDAVLPGFQEAAAARAEVAAMAAAVLATFRPSGASPRAAAAPPSGRSAWVAAFGPRAWRR